MSTVAEEIKRLQNQDPNEEICLIIWSLEDVEHQAKEDGVELTDQECVDVLGMLKKYHDCSYGISWDTISSHIDTIVMERKG